MEGIRYLFAIASFFCVATNYAVRINLNVAIVAMVNSSSIYRSDNQTVSSDCLPPINIFDGNNPNETHSFSKDGEFMWSPSTQGIILGAFYYGYVCFQIIAGRLSEVYSGKWVFATGSFIAALLALLTPTAARYSVPAFVILRALQGLAQGAMFPSMYAMASHWLPDSERGVFSSVIHSGVNVGIVVGMIVTGYLCNSELFNGWPSVFYIFGSMNCLMIIIWCTLVTDSPQTHRFITKKELKYIVSNQETEMNKYKPPISWRKILTSVPVWSLIIVDIGLSWCFFILINELPTFFATVLHFDIQKNGILSSTPFLIKTVVGGVVGCVTDALLRKRIATVNFIRKSCTAIASIAISIGFAGVCLSGCNATLCVVFLMCSIPMIGFCYSGHSIIHLSLSPEYAGTLLGITNTFASLMGFSAPMFVGFITDEHQSLREWHTVFGTSIGVLLLSSFVFLVFGSTKRQEWVAEEVERTALVESPNSYTILK